MKRCVPLRDVSITIQTCKNGYILRSTNEVSISETTVWHTFDDLIRGVAFRLGLIEIGEALSVIGTRDGLEKE